MYALESDIYNLQNLYKFTLQKANGLLREHHPRSAAIEFKKAADIQSRLAEMTDGAAAKAHLLSRRECEEMARSILASFPVSDEDLASAKKTVSKPAGTSQPAAPAAKSAPAAQKPAAAPAKTDGDDEELKNFKPERYLLSQPKNTFDDIVGMDKFIDDFKKNLEAPLMRQKYPKLDMGSIYFEHCLLYGPPGSGKSFLCGAIANYVYANFDNSAVYLLDAADILSKYVGESEQKLKAIFRDMEKYSLAILVIDEIDRIGASRDGERVSEHAQNLTTQLLTLLQGVGGRTNAMLIGGTNYPWAIDRALRSRMSLQAYLGYPDRASEEKHLRKTLGRCLGRTPAEREAKIGRIVDALIPGRASYRLLDAVANEVTKRSFYATIEQYPENFDVEEPVPIPGAELDGVLVRYPNKDYDEEYISRLENPEIWNEKAYREWIARKRRAESEGAEPVSVVPAQAGANPVAVVPAQGGVSPVAVVPVQGGVSPVSVVPVQGGAYPVSVVPVQGGAYPVSVVPAQAGADSAAEDSAKQASDAENANSSEGESPSADEPSPETENPQDAGETPPVPVEEIRVPVGKTERGETVYWEFGNKALSNRHMVVTGMSGYGKTYAIQALLYELSLASVPAVVFDYTNGFLPEKLDGAFLSRVGDSVTQYYAYNGRLPINPFKRQTIRLSEMGDTLPESSVDVAGRFADILKHVYDFGSQQFSAVYRACRDGIEEYGDRMNFAVLRANMEEQGGASAKSALSKMQQLLDRDIFDTKNAFDWSSITSRGRRVSVIQLAGLDSEIQTVITEMLLWDMWYSVSRFGSEARPFAVVLDEAHNLSFDRSSPSVKILQEGRKFGWSAWFATQFTESALSDAELSRLQQAAQTLIFHPVDRETESTAKLLSGNGSPQAWISSLSKLGKGDCVVRGSRLDENGALTPPRPAVVHVTAIGDRGKDETPDNTDTEVKNRDGE